MEPSSFLADEKWTREQGTGLVSQLDGKEEGRSPHGGCALPEEHLGPEESCEQAQDCTEAAERSSAEAGCHPGTSSFRSVSGVPGPVKPPGDQRALGIRNHRFRGPEGIGSIPTRLAEAPQLLDPGSAARRAALDCNLPHAPLIGRTVKNLMAAEVAGGTVS